LGHDRILRGRVAIRGGNCNNGAQCPGALNLNNDPANANWNIGARAALSTGRCRIPTGTGQSTMSTDRVPRSGPGPGAKHCTGRGGQ
jgi:hypothetical protein